MAMQEAMLKLSLLEGLKTCIWTGQKRQWVIRESACFFGFLNPQASTIMRPALIYTKDRFPTFCSLRILEALPYIVLSCGHMFWVTLVIN